MPPFVGPSPLSSGPTMHLCQAAVGSGLLLGLLVRHPHRVARAGVPQPRRRLPRGREAALFSSSPTSSFGTLFPILTFYSLYMLESAGTFT